MAFWSATIHHPRAWGTFPRVLGHYARDLELLSLEEAVEHMTSRPARRLGLKERGVIAPGKAADLVLFDAATVADRATYENPTQASVGIVAVWVNGVVAVEGGRTASVRAGVCLRSERP